MRRLPPAAAWSSWSRSPPFDAHRCPHAIDGTLRGSPPSSDSSSTRVRRAVSPVDGSHHRAIGRRGWRRLGGSGSTGRPSTGDVARARSRWRSSTSSTPGPAPRSPSTGRASTWPAPRCWPTAPTSRRPGGCLRSSARTRSGASSSASRAPAPTSASLRTEHGARRRGWRLAAHRPEGVDLVCAVRPVGDVPGARAERITCFAVDMTAPGVDIRPLVQITGRGRVQRGLPRRRRSCPTTASSAPSTTGWARGHHHAWPTSAARTSRSRNRSCTRCTSTSCTAPRDLDDPEVADALARAFVELRVLRLHNWRTLSRLLARRGARVPSRAGSSWRGPT